MRADAVRVATDLLAARVRQASERTSEIVELAGLLERLARAVEMPPGLGRGMLRSLPREGLAELRSALDHIEQLEALIACIGRLRESEDDARSTMLERIGRFVSREVEVQKTTPSERGHEIRGIERSGELARMVASEAALLTRPILKKIWLARWAEQSLLTYHAPGVLTNRVKEKQTFEDGFEDRHRRADRGPIIAILDTSGSMAGGANLVARALVVQMAAVASIEKRQFYLYNFSGPGDIAEVELSFDGDGLMRLLAFASMSFDGGTVVDEPVRRACARIDEAGWRQADIVVVSDGDFGVAPHCRRCVERARRASAVRLHGLRLGSGSGFDALGCDVVHDVSVWGTRTPVWS